MLQQEAKETLIKETEPKTADVDIRKTFTPSEIFKAPELVKKKKTEEPAKVENVLEPKSDIKGQLSSPSFVKKPAEPAKVVKPKSGNISENNGLAKTNIGEVKQAEGQRSANPFAKSSNNQQKTSVLGSLKKLNKNEGASNK